MDEKTIAALREVFEKWAREQRYPIYDLVAANGPASSMPGTNERFSKLAWEGFLACYQHLAPQLMDVQRLDWMLEKSAFMVWTKRDGSILQCQAYTQDEDEEYHVLSGEHRYFNTPREAIDAAREQEKKTC